MIDAFGGTTTTVLRRLATVPGEDDLRGVIASASAADGPPTLLLSRCAPTAAFSRRDLLLPGHAAAEDAVRGHGFVPVVRPVGGHLAGYDEGSLVVHLWGAHPDPRTGLQERFRLVGHALAEALRDLGVDDPRVGPVPGEYCDGAWSVNVAGRAKVAGTGQRIFKRSYLFCAVLTVARPEPLRAMLTDAYDALDLPFDPATVGAVEDHVPGVSVEQVREVVAAHLTRTLADPPELAPLPAPGMQVPEQKRFVPLVAQVPHISSR